MNRAERRKYEKQGYDKDLILSKYRQESFEQGYITGIRNVYRDILLITAYIAQDELGLGKTRLPRLMGRIINTIDAFRTENLQPNDTYEMKAVCKRYGFDIDSIK